MCIRDSVWGWSKSARTPFQFGPAAHIGYSNGSEAAIADQGLQTPAFSRDVPCLLYTSDAADERSSVDLGGRRTIKKQKKRKKKQKTLSETY